MLNTSRPPQEGAGQLLVRLQMLLLGMDLPWAPAGCELVKALSPSVCVGQLLWVLSPKMAEDSSLG